MSIVRVTPDRTNIGAGRVLRKPLRALRQRGFLFRGAAACA